MQVHAGVLEPCLKTFWMGSASREPIVLHNHILFDLLINSSSFYSKRFRTGFFRRRQGLLEDLGADLKNFPGLVPPDGGQPITKLNFMHGAVLTLVLKPKPTGLAKCLRYPRWGATRGGWILGARTNFEWAAGRCKLWEIEGDTSHNF